MSTQTIQVDLRKLLIGPHSGDSPDYGSRVYADHLAQDVTYPAVSMDFDSIDFDEDFQGDNGFSEHSFSVTIYGDSPGEVAACLFFIKSKLHGFAGGSFDTGTETITLSNTLQRVSVSGGSSYYDEVTRNYAMDAILDITTQS
jgi:hypothetical protein